MRAVLEFQLPEEQEEFERAARANVYHWALIDLSSFLRSQVKYADLPKEQMAVYEAIRAEFYQVLNNHNIGDVP